MVNVLFICLGNICRSPMAEAVFADLIEKKGMKQEFNADSAGTGNWHAGDLPHPGTRKILEEHNVSCVGITARQIRKEDWKQFDYFVAMDQQTMDDLKEWQEAGSTPAVTRLMEYCTDAEILDIPDPYFTGDFNQAYQLIQAGVYALFEELVKKHNLKPRSGHNEF